MLVCGCVRLSVYGNCLLFCVPFPLKMPKWGFETAEEKAHKKGSSTKAKNEPEELTR